MQTLKNWWTDLFLYMMKKYRGLSVQLGLLQIKDGVYGSFDYEGYRASSLVHDPRLMKKCEEFDDFRDDDVLVLSYPKTGTHFLADVIHSIYLEKKLITKETDHVFGALMPLEIITPGKTLDSVHKTIADAPSPRVIGTHLPWRLLPPKVKSHQVKVIVCIRNPKDAACSAFPFAKRMGIMPAETTWEQFLDIFTSGRAMSGDYFDYLHSWYPNRNSPNNLHVYYEDMIQDLDKEVRKIAKFLGHDLTDEQVARIVKDNTFANLKKKVGNTVIHRQGKSGSWRSQFTLEQNDLVDEWIEKGKQGLDDIKLQYD